MKKYVTLNSLQCAAVSSIAYAFGYLLSKRANMQEWLCIVIALIACMLVEELVGRIVYTEYIQEKTGRRIVLFIFFVLLFLFFNRLSYKLFDKSLYEDLFYELGYAVVFGILGFVLCLVKEYAVSRRIISKYGDGRNGFRFTSEERKYINGLNGRNKRIYGEYDPDCAVRLASGTYVGEKDRSLTIFRGIPYAKPPVGNLRFKKPEKVDDGDGIYEAIYFGPSSLQSTSKSNSLKTHNQSEDCLYLNVCTSEVIPDDPKQVVVVFHNGDFSSGGAAEPLCDIYNYALKNPELVVVSFNYRLGILGFIDLSSVPGGEEYQDSNNLGILDQIALLEWVKENISQFGGDPNDITIIGEGSGGESISLLCACDKAKGLFNKAIMFSGNPVFAYTFNNQEYSNRLIRDLNIRSMDDLINLSEEDIKKLNQEYVSIPSPVCDNRLIPKHISEAYENGSARDVDIIVGTSRNNSSVFNSYVGKKKGLSLIEENINEVILSSREDIAERIVKYIEKQSAIVGQEEAKKHFVDLWHDNFINAFMAHSLNKGNSNVHMMYWNVDELIDSLGSGGVNVISTFLGNDIAANSYGYLVDGAIKDILQKLLKKFIMGEPLKLFNEEVSGIDSLDWETYPKVLEIEKDSIRVDECNEVLKESHELIEEIGLFD